MEEDVREEFSYVKDAVHHPVRQPRGVILLVGALDGFDAAAGEERSRLLLTYCPNPGANLLLPLALSGRSQELPEHHIDQGHPQLRAGHALQMLQGHGYLRDVGRVCKADEVAEQRGAVAKHQVEPQERSRTCPGDRGDGHIPANITTAKRDPGPAHRVGFSPQQGEEARVSTFQLGITTTPS